MTAKPEVLHGTPDHDHAVARCYGPQGRGSSGWGHGVTWKHLPGASLNNVRCPVDGGPLYQTTRGWRNNVWNVVPADVVKAAAGKKRAEKKKQQQAMLDAGTHKLARDVQPGDIVVAAGRRSNIPSGLVVDVEKVGSKIRLTTSRTRNEVARGYLYHGHWEHADLEARATKLEEITATTDVTATTLFVVDIKLHGSWRAWVPNSGDHRARPKEEFAGWASEHPVAAIAELWNNEVKRWTKYLEEKSYTRPVVQGHYESDEHYAQRVEKERVEADARKAQAELALTVATDRLVLHTGSAAISSDEVVVVS